MKNGAEQPLAQAGLRRAPSAGGVTAGLRGGPYGGVRCAKGSVAAVRFNQLPAVGQGELRGLVTAKVLGC